MTIWLGPLGNLQALPSIGRGIGAAPDLGASSRRTLGGRQVVQRVGQPRRTFRMSRELMTADEWAVVEALAYGAFGPGPHVLIEPWQRNLLRPNQSSGTDVLRDATGFAAASGGTPASSSVQAHTGARSVAWPVTAANQRLVLADVGSIASADPVTAVPVLPSTAYTFSGRGRLLGSTGTLRLDVSWFTAAGVFISTSTGTGVALSTSAWSAVLSCTATSPATAALALGSLTNTAFGASTTIYGDSLQLEQAGAASGWVFGAGVPRVSFVELGHDYPVMPYHNTEFELAEVN